VVGTRFFKHFVENAPAGGSSRFLAIRSSDKVVHQGFLFALLILFLLIVVPLRAPVGAHGILVLAFPLVLVTAKDGTNCLLAGGEVGNDVHQALAVMGVLRPNSRTNSLQVVPERKAMMMSELVMLGSSVRCLEKCQM
jgi:hypothetical protein